MSDNSENNSNVQNTTYTFGETNGKTIAPLVPGQYKPKTKYYSERPQYTNDEIIIEEYEKLLIDLNEPEFIEYQKKLSNYIKEFLHSGLGEEFYQSISEIDKSIYRYEVVNQIVDMGLDQTDYGKELVSKLLSYLYSKLLLMKDIEIGFYCLLKRESDLSVDIPDINIQLGRFIARAIIDEILPPAFIIKEEIVKLPSVRYAKVLLTFQENYIHSIWGKYSSGKLSDLKDEINEIIRLYFLNSDLNQCIKEIQHLHCEYYHHEIIRVAISMAMDYTKNGDILLIQLIKELHNTYVTDISQIKNGFLRLQENMDELLIDVPRAKEFLDSYKLKLKELNIMIE